MTDPPFATVRLKRFFLKPSCFDFVTNGVGDRGNQRRRHLGAVQFFQMALVFPHSQAERIHALFHEALLFLIRFTQQLRLHFKPFQLQFSLQLGFAWQIWQVFGSKQLFAVGQY